jgi:copper(I)-binding protein
LRHQLIQGADKMKKLLAVATLVAVVVLAACSPSGAAKPSVENVWGHASPGMADAGAFFMMIRNPGNQADKLTSARADACGVVELHEMYMKDDGTMGMRPVTGGAIEVPAGGSVELKPGGLHVMCLQKKGEFTAGTKVPLTLVFEKGGELKTEAEIRAE